MFIRKFSLFPVHGKSEKNKWIHVCFWSNCLFVFFSNVTINMGSEFHSWCISAFYEIFRADRSAYCVLLQ